MAAVCAFKSVGAMALSAISPRAVHERGCVRSCVRGPAMGFLLMAWVSPLSLAITSDAVEGPYDAIRPTRETIGITRIILSSSATLRHSLSRLADPAPRQDWRKHLGPTRGRTEADTDRTDPDAEADAGRV
jgi:hypothetical protein